MTSRDDQRFPTDRVEELKARLAASAAAMRRAQETAERAIEHARDQSSSLSIAQRIEALTRALDVSEHEKNAALELTSDKDRYLAAFAHEIRQAVHASQTAVAVCRVRTQVPAVLHACDVLDRQMERIARLVDDVVDTARGTMQKLTITRARIDLRDVLETALATARPRIDERRHRVALSCGDRPLWVNGDRIRLEQVFANLLVNAALYTPEGGAIDIASRADEATIVSEVRDNGRGMSASEIETVFRPFTQTGESSGLGVGLALAATIVALHDGSIDAHSGGAGKGSTFRVTLPRAAA